MTTPAWIIIAWLGAGALSAAYGLVLRFKSKRNANKDEPDAR